MNFIIISSYCFLSPNVIITFIDINDRIDLLRRYEKLSKRYENIIFSMSHDIKGPLSNMAGLIDALRDMQGEEADKKPIINMLSQSVSSMHQSVVELADIGDSDTDFARAA